MDHFTHAARDHGTRQTHKDEAPGISKHLLEGLETLKDVPALKGGVAKGLDQVEKRTRFSKIQMLNRAFQKGGPRFWLHVHPTTF